MSAGPDESTVARGPVLVVVGPTAVGKTAVVLALARSMDGEVVSLDSRQVYRGMDIGTAKPDPAALEAVPHHLIDVADPDQTLSLAQVQQLAYAAIDAIAARRRVPILAGGTGQYFRAVVEGWSVPQVAPRPELRRRLLADATSEGRHALHARLVQCDPVAAARIHPHNVRRVVRALEVAAVSGRPMSELAGRVAPPYDFIIVGLRRPRDELHARIDRRVEQFLADGLEAEVRALVQAGYGFDLPAMSGLGYGEWRDYFAGTATVDDVVGRIKARTRRLAARQAAWFRADDPHINWIDIAHQDAGTVAALIQATSSERAKA